MRIAVLDDHYLFRELLIKICQEDSRFSVVGETGLCAEGYSIVCTLRPDLVLLDLFFPDGDGFELAQIVARDVPNCRIIAISSNCDDYTVFRAEKHRLAGFLDKSTLTIATLRTALNEVAQGRNFFCGTFIRISSERLKSSTDFGKILSDREIELLSLIGSALTDQEIGARLRISPTTVQTHRSHIMRKLGISSTPKLIHFALTRGFVNRFLQQERAVGFVGGKTKPPPIRLTS
jgi:two-component system response regulator NreC